MLCGDVRSAVTLDKPLRKLYNYTNNPKGNKIMKQYKIVTLDTADFDRANTLNVDEYVWGGEYRPKTSAKMLFTADGTLWLKMTCEEKNPKAVHLAFDEEVWLDSCMECFFGFVRGGKYINCEMNSLGVSKIGVGEGRDGRTSIHLITDIPKIKAEKTEGEWSVSAVFTPKILKDVFGGDYKTDKGTVLFGNLFKVGEETHTPHYGMWNPIVWDVPDFHRPECFGEFIID